MHNASSSSSQQTRRDVGRVSRRGSKTGSGGGAKRGEVLVRLKSTKRAVPLALLVMAVGCERFTGHAVRDWSEDVALGDGRTITIDRHVEFDVSNSLAGDAYSATLTKSAISFRGSPPIPRWDFPMEAMVFYQDANSSEWVVVATMTSCQVWDVRGKPQPPYWEFRLRGPSWSEVAVSDGSFGRRTNLFIGYEPGFRPNTSHLRLTEKYLSHGH